MRLDTHNDTICNYIVIPTIQKGHDLFLLLVHINKKTYDRYGKTVIELTKYLLKDVVDMLLKMKVFRTQAFFMVVVVIFSCFMPVGTANAPAATGAVLEIYEPYTPYAEIVLLTDPPLGGNPMGESPAVDIWAQESPVDEDIVSDVGDSGADDIYDDEVEEPEPVSNIVTLTISAAGDTTLGGIYNGGTQMFIREFEKQDKDYGYFLRNVKHIFEEDDLTILNLEVALTDATAYKDKTYVLRGPPHFAKILSCSGVDVVSIANNHSQDFYERGYRDTTTSLEAEGIAYFGNEYKTILEVEGVSVGLFGFSFWGDGRSNERAILAAIDDLMERGAQLVIAYYHWGIERDITPSRYQRNLARYSIDNGADLVLGAHPHVLQTIEEYKGKNIVYSLGNFSFGANNNPADKYTIIFQQTFTFEDGLLQDTNDINIVPALISSERGRNNFQPTIAEGEDVEKIMKRLFP